MTAQKAEPKGRKPDFRLDILIKRQDDYYQAHCLQFDLITTDDTLEGAQESILNSCISHIIFSVENGNIEYLYSPAPKEVWAEYYSMAEDESCTVVMKKLSLPKKAKPSHSQRAFSPFTMQEVVCYA